MKEKKIDTNAELWKKKKKDRFFLKRTGKRMFATEATEENKLYYPERRVYYTKAELERDFGKI